MAIAGREGGLPHPVVLLPEVRQQVFLQARQAGVQPVVWAGEGLRDERVELGMHGVHGRVAQRLGRVRRFHVDSLPELVVHCINGRIN
ncbi:hypothetical protein ACHFCA_25925 [Delftia tsuruhatensis]